MSVQQRMRIALLTVGVAVTDQAALAEDPVLVGTWPGYIRQGLDIDTYVAVQGDLVYLPGGPAGVHILDVSNPAAPVRVGEYAPPGEWAGRGLAVSGELGCFAFGSAVHVVSLREPTSPVFLSSIEGWWGGIAIAENYVVLSSNWPEGSLRIVDLRDPESPIEIVTMPMQYAYGLAIHGTHAYVAGWVDGLFIFDLNDPAAPPTIATLLNSDGGASRIAISGSRAYVGSSSYVNLLDISRPTEPVLLGRYRAAPPWGLAASGSTAFVATDEQQVWYAVDFSDPAAPRRLGSYSHPFPAGAAVVSNGLLFGSGEASGLQIIDISDPSKFVRVGSFNSGGSPSAMDFAGRHLYVADGGGGLQIVDVNDPSAPRTVGAVYPSKYAQDVAVSGRYAYLCDNDHLNSSASELHIIDVNDPGQPRSVGRLRGLHGSGVTVAGPWAFVAVNSPSALQVVDVSDPSAPRRAGRYDTPGVASDVAMLGGDRVVVADWNAGLHVIDVSNPAAPIRIGGIATGGYAGRVAVRHPYAFVAAADAGLVIVDVSHPASPTRVSSHPAAFFRTHDVAVSGNFAYVIDSAGGFENPGLEILDISDPATPVVLAVVPPRELQVSYGGIAAAGNYVYLGGFWTGIDILRLSSAELRLERSEGQAILSWPVAAADYTLESATTPVPGTIWSAVSAGVTTTGDRNQVAIDTQGEAGFYRLRKE